MTRTVAPSRNSNAYSLSVTPAAATESCLLWLCQQRERGGERVSKVAAIARVRFIGGNIQLQITIPLQRPHFSSELTWSKFKSLFPPPFPHPLSPVLILLSFQWPGSSRDDNRLENRHNPEELEGTQTQCSSFPLIFKEKTLSTLSIFACAL